MKKTYKVKGVCNNCGHLGDFNIPIGKGLIEHTADSTCVLCGCTGTYNVIREQTQGYYISRRLSLPNYSNKHPYESKEFGAHGTSFEDAQAKVSEEIDKYLLKLRGTTNIKTKE